jgi:hypothetical protein
MIDIYWLKMINLKHQCTKILNVSEEFEYQENLGLEYLPKNE